MNDELNPFIYKFLPVRRRSLLRLFSRLTFGRINFIQWLEERAERRVRSKIIEQLNLADLVMLCDSETLAAVHACGDVPGTMVGSV
ncbi:MAG: hypothetical protein OES84_01255 [Kiritimatiellaceae bacterium]|nr:hypothetical protein [Kiritimatiellaceae bacterium]